MSVALAIAAAACAYVASKSSSDELRGAYRDSAQDILRVGTTAFDRSHDPAALRSPTLASGEVRELRERHTELDTVSVYRAGAGNALVSAGQHAGGPGESALALEAMNSGKRASAELREGDRYVEVLATPLRDGGRVAGALAVTYDLSEAHTLLGERNQRVALVLAVLLFMFTIFTAVVLGRGIFRPLHRLRLATQAVGAGDLSTRLGWRRHDELGQLARDFDAMAVDLEENNQRLEELAHRDPLTGLANHRRFQEVLGKELDNARRDGRPLAVVILDIDHFKRINDSRGHPFGDELLFSAAASLRSAMRDIGSVARVGGDEFGLVIPDADGSRALALAEAARTAVQAAAPMRGGLRCSAGIACFPEDARGAGALLQLADGALSWAKDMGRGRSQRYDPEHVFVVTEEQREEFSELIAQPASVQPVFQPIVSLTTGEAVGFEALARFEGKPGLPPSWWFSQAHRFGLGGTLEAESVRAALVTAGRPPGSFLSVNLSPSALASTETAAVLPDDLDGVVIEITEEERVLDVEALQRHLDPLRARGARIAVDDAGEGYAGLQQVMSMRADIIKLDRALVADVHADPAKIALIGSLVHFARSTGAVICAEGVETHEELRVLIHLGVAYGQGWAMGRPGAAWPPVNPDAARLCREMRSEQAKVVPLGSKRSGAGGG